jgi:hypothetical protein
MKKIKIQPTILQILYLVIFSIIFSLVIFTPVLIKGPVQLTSKMLLREEIIEGTLLCTLLIMSILILNLYKREIDRHKELINKISTEKMKVENRLFDSEQYIGITNIQIQEIKYIFNSIDKFPETKEDLKKAFTFFGERVIGIVNSNWVLFRIIDSDTQRTICEHFIARHGFSCSYPHVSNKMIIERQPIPPFIYVISSPKNLNIIVSSTMPVDQISNDQQIFVQAILNEITKLFVILNSLYNKKGNKILVEELNAKM